MMSNETSNTAIARLRRSIADFRHSEDGVMTLFVVLMIIFLIPLIGISVTISRVEHLRTRIQGTMDRAVLAAADIDQQRPPRDVVLDYFAKAGLSQFIDANDIVVDPDTSEALRTGRKVSICGRGYVRTNITDLNVFTDGNGKPNITIAREMEDWGFTTCAAAEEAKSDIEVTLVLDVSGSMNSSNRLPNLQDAAEEFVDTVLVNSTTTEGAVGIAIVPYAGQVNAQPLFPYLPITGTHTYGNCINFPSTSFNQTPLLPSGTTSLERANVFDPWYSSKSNTLTYCPLTATQRILPMTNDPAVLRAHIRAMTAAGNTSLDIGMKWGVGMNDPSFRPVINQMITAGLVPATFSERPFDFRARSVAKFMILMSDGENTSEYIILNPYRGGLSPVWRSASGQLTIHHPTGNGSSTSKFYRFDNNTWSTSPYLNSTQLTWPDVWANYTINWVARYLYGTPLNWSNSQRNSWIATVRGATQPSVKDQRTSSICRAAKDAGITIFTIGFEAPQVGNAALLDCATSPGHFFDVNGVEISTAFQTIARRISELRLTQ